MSVASLQEIRTAVKTVLEAEIPDLGVYRTVTDVVQTPAVVVQPATSDFHVAMGRGTDTWELDLLVLVGWTDSELAQDELDAYITGAGPRSIRQAVSANRRLGRTDLDATISGLTEYGMKTAAQIDHLAAVLRLVVHTTGTA